MSDAPLQLRRVRPNVHWVRLRKVRPEWQPVEDLDLNVSPTVVWLGFDLMPAEAANKVALLRVFFSRVAKMIMEEPKTVLPEEHTAIRQFSVLVDPANRRSVEVALGVRFEEDGTAYLTCAEDWTVEEQNE